MRVRDIMTTKVITISSNASIADADDLMSSNKIRRLPVVDDGKLVGVISKDGIMKASAPCNVPVAVWRMPHFFFGMKVKEVMSKKMVTATPDMSASAAAYLAQQNRVGCLPVMEKDKLVGIITTNDFFFRVLNPLLGVWQHGTLFTVNNPGNAHNIQEVFRSLAKYNVKVLAVRYIDNEKSEEKNLAIRVETTNEKPILAELKAAGFHVEVVQLGDEKKK